MSDEFDDIIDELLEGENEPPDPTYRATIRNGRITLTNWAGFMATGAAWTSFLEARERAGVAIADLTLTGEDNGELIVRFYAHGRSKADAEEAICDWARRLGYRRVWLSDHMVELEPDPEELGKAQVRCKTCGARWRDSSPEFWLWVRDQGSFPRWCMLCGCELPQWSVAEPAPDENGPEKRPQARRRSTNEWSASDKRPRKRQEKS